MKNKLSLLFYRPLRLLRQFTFSAFIMAILGCAFWLEGDLKHASFPSSGQPAELYANQEGDDLTHAYTKAIDNAKQSVLLIIYSLNDRQVISSLRMKSQQGVNVRVICDGNASPHIESKLDPRIAITRRFGPGLMHLKILVIDSEQTLLGSANMTTESLRMHGNLVMGFNDLSLAHYITTKANSIKAEDYTPAFPYENFLIGDQKVELWFLPDNRDAIPRLKDLIRSAKKTIRIAMFTWTRQDLANEVIAATRRGIKTEVVIDHYSGEGASRKIVSHMRNQGVKVTLSRGGPLLHHKFLYIDSEILVNGSANWTKAAFTKNDDCFVVLHNLTSPQKEQMEALWKTISSESH